MKIKLARVGIERTDRISVSIDVEDQKPILKKRTNMLYQPTELTVKRSRSWENGKISEISFHNIPGWYERGCLYARRVLKSGALGAQVTELSVYWDDVDKTPWYDEALKIAHERLDQLSAEIDAGEHPGS